MEDIFDQQVAAGVVRRIGNLSPDARPIWGKMTVAQMLAHCNVTYELVYDNKHAQPKGFKKFMLKLFVKPLVVSEKPYKQNGPTAPEFLVKETKDFSL